MFQPSIVEHTIELKDNEYVVASTDDVEVSKGSWKSVKNIMVGDFILNSDNIQEVVKGVYLIGNEYHIVV